MAFIKNLMKLKRSRRLKGPLGTPDLIVVGLGNPGPQYENTRHNAGWWLIDLLAERYDIEVRRAHSTARVGVGKVEGRTVALVKPRTHVNGSGEAARYLLARFRTTRDRLLIVYDETALPPGNPDASPRRPADHGDLDRPGDRRRQRRHRLPGSVQAQRPDVQRRDHRGDADQPDQRLGAGDAGGGGECLGHRARTPRRQR